MEQRVTTRTDRHVALVRLARPEKRNAVDIAMLEALLAAAESIREDRSVRAVVLTGEGPDFCAGIDLSFFDRAGIGEDGPDIMTPLDDSAANIVQAAVLCWRRLPVPVIAAISGAAFGAGLQLALGADLRYAGTNAKLSVMEVRWGLIPDMGFTVTARHVLRQDSALELACTGRIVAADEAAALGLVTAVADEPLDRAMSVAADIAARSPDAVRAIKQLVHEAWEDDPEASLRREARLQHGVLQGDNQREAAHANAERRRPVFRDRGT